MRLKIHFLWMLPLILASRSSTEYLKTDDSTVSYPWTHPESIEVFSTDIISREYTIIGAVHASVDAGVHAETAVRDLRKEARKLGADAIINLRLEIGYGYWSNSIKSSGTAIKYVK